MIPKSLNIFCVLQMNLPKPRMVKERHEQINLHLDVCLCVYYSENNYFQIQAISTFHFYYISKNLKIHYFNLLSLLSSIITNLDAILNILGWNLNMWLHKYECQTEFILSFWRSTQLIQLYNMQIQYRWNISYY